MGRLTPGERIPAIPADDWNSFIDARDAVKSLTPKGNGPGGSENDAHGSLTVKNDTSGDLPEYAILDIGGPAFAGEAKQKFKKPFGTGDTPDADTGTDFVVAQAPVKDGKTVEAVGIGYTFAHIDVSDDNHEFCTSQNANNTLLKSADSGVPIVWKEAGTGEKFALIKLGGGGGGNATLRGALAVIKGTVPKSSGIDVSGTIGESTKLFTRGYLAASATATTFIAGALLVNPDETPVWEDGGIVAVDVFNPSYTDFIGEGPGVLVAGSLMRWTEIVEEEEVEFEAFLLPRFELRTEPGFVLGSHAENDAQGIYHEGAARDQKIGREDC